MKIDGIEGQVTQQEHRNWIELKALGWGLGRIIRTKTGSANNREASVPGFSSIKVTKLFDNSSYNFFKESVQTRAITTKIDFTTTGSPSVVYASYVLSNCILAGYGSLTDGKRHIEHITLNFTKIEFKFIPYDDKNMPGTPTTVSYNQATTVKS